MTDTRPRIPIALRDYKSSAQVVIITNYQLGVACDKIIEDASAVANLNQLNIRHGMTGIPTAIAQTESFLKDFTNASVSAASKELSGRNFKQVFDTFREVK